MKPREVEQWLKNTGHDVAWLIRSWRSVARKAGWRCEVLYEAGGWPCLALRKGSRQGAGVYFSAGMHGDEAAPPLALLAWAQTDPGAFAAAEGVIFPCLNPWGLQHNSRTNERGLDLNRLWHHARHRQIRALKQFLGTERFQFGLCLHEDFDARGIYLYEPWLARTKSPGRDWGSELLRVGSQFLPIDSRREIDGRRVNRRGHFFREVTEEEFAEMGWPEAIYLAFRHTERSLTFETPSERDLAVRVAAHVAVIQHVLRLAGEEVSGSK
jgi:hypothetical protein